MDKRWNDYLRDERFRTPSTRSKYDGRDPFENDYSRLISSAPFRRLQDKTQVFPLEKSDFPRTRLTHSLEVSSIARSIGKSIETILLDKQLLPEKFKGQLSSLLSAAGLVHDLGNPPFGHFGEKAIQSYFQEYFSTHETTLNPQEKADFEKFDGNVQTLRILRKLYFLIDENGYNLSYPTLHVIVKYPCSSIDGNAGKHMPNIKHKKFGFFCSEQEDYKLITEKLKTNYNRHPLTFLLEAADDIAYSSADIEDAVKLGVLDSNTIIEVLSPFIPNSKIELLNEFKKSYRILKNTNLDVNDIAIQRFRISIQRILIESIIDEFVNNYEKIMSGKYENELLEKCKCHKIKKGLDAIMKIILNDKRVINIELAGWNIIRGLLAEYIPACLKEDFKKDSKTKEGRLYQTISSSYRYLYERHNDYPNDTYKRIQLITDFISGMTDNYALELFQKLKGIRTV